MCIRDRAGCCCYANSHFQRRFAAKELLLFVFEAFSHRAWCILQNDCLFNDEYFAVCFTKICAQTESYSQKYVSRQLPQVCWMACSHMTHRSSSASYHRICLDRSSLLTKVFLALPFSILHQTKQIHGLPNITVFARLWKTYHHLILSHPIVLICEIFVAIAAWSAWNTSDFTCIPSLSSIYSMFLDCEVAVELQS